MIKKVTTLPSYKEECSVVNELVDVANTAMVTVKVTIDAPANETPKAFTVPIDMEIVDVVVHATADSTYGTARLRTGTTAISDAIDASTEPRVARALTLNPAEKTVEAGTELNVITGGTAGANTRAEVYVVGRAL